MRAALAGRVEPAALVEMRERLAIQRRSATGFARLAARLALEVWRRLALIPHLLRQRGRVMGFHLRLPAFRRQRAAARGRLVEMAVALPLGMAQLAVDLVVELRPRLPIALAALEAAHSTWSLEGLITQLPDQSQLDL